MTLSERAKRRMLVAAFAVYLVLLAWIILWKLAVPWIGGAAFLPHPIKLVPFFPEGDAGASAPLEVLVNVALFVPFGVYLRLLAPRWRWWAVTGVFVGASLLLETTQHLLSIGSFDISDVISNTIGGLLGVGLFALAHRRFRARTTTVMTRICLIFTLVFLLGSAIFIASPLRFAQQPDVVVHGPFRTKIP